MKKLRLLLAAALAVPLLATGNAGAQVPTPTGFGARGVVYMTMHTHSGAGLLFPTDRLSFNLTPGETFSYSSRRCTNNAPFNDIGLNFVPDYPGVDDDDGTASARYHVEGTVTSVFDGRGTIQGRITAVLCVPGNSPNGQVESQHSIVMHYRATFVRVSDNDLQVIGTFQFSPTESTGTFRDIVGGGIIRGRFTCLGALTNPSAPTCADLGEYTDFVVSTGDPTLPAGQLQPGAFGAYFDPTVQTAGSTGTA